MPSIHFYFRSTVVFLRQFKHLCVMLLYVHRQMLYWIKMLQKLCISHNCEAMRLNEDSHDCDSCVSGYFYRLFNYSSLTCVPALFTLFIINITDLFIFTAPIKNKWHYPFVERSLQSVETTSPCIQLGNIHAPQSISCWGNCWLPRHKDSSFVIPKTQTKQTEKSPLFFFFFYRNP